MSFLTDIRNRVPLSERHLKWLGTAAGWSYAEHKGQLLAVNDRPLDDETVKEYQTRPGELLVNRTREIAIEDGQRMQVAGTHLAVEVSDDAWEKAQARRPSKAKPSGPRVWDSLAPYRQRQADVQRIPLREPANPDVGALKAQLGIEEAKPWIERPQGGIKDPSPSGLVDYLRRRGISLELGRGRLIARSEKPMNISDVTLLERAEALIVGELSGVAVLCSLCSEPATTIVMPRAPMCAEHAQ